MTGDEKKIGNYTCSKAQIIIPVTEEDLKEYEEWRTLEYGQDKEPLKTANKQSLHECVNDMVAAHGRKITMFELVKLFEISRKQAKNLMKRSRRK